MQRQPSRLPFCVVEGRGAGAAGVVFPGLQAALSPVSVSIAVHVYGRVSSKTAVFDDGGTVEWTPIVILGSAVSSPGGLLGYVASAPKFPVPRRGASGRFPVNADGEWGIIVIFVPEDEL